MLSAVSWSLTDTFGKKLTKQYQILQTLAYRYIFSIPFLGIYFLFINIPKIDPRFWITILILLPLELTAAILYLKAITISPLSLVTPFVAFTPAFLLLTSYIILGETVSMLGAVGILLITIGAYTINFSSKNFLIPFKKIFKEKGIWLMLIVAFIYSITSNLGKVAMRYSSPSFMAVFYTTLLGIVFAFLALVKKQKLKLQKFEFSLGSIGFFNAIMMISHMIAIKYVQVAYMIAVKRTSMLFGVFFGYLFFHEKRIGKRFFSACLMLVGVILIVFAR
ncbi:MAG: DMT family transporter [Candidatus Cloacimonetes bacterium]|nr:DMT family transporter [Candidatus Cloacimonadota bacterium]